MPKQVKKRAPVSPPPEAADAPLAGDDSATGQIFGLQPRQILIGILVLGALLRVVYLLSIQSHPDYNLPTGDAAFKDFWARAILTGDATPRPGELDPELATSPYVRPPGYPFFLAFVYLLTGYSYTAVRVLQMAIGLLSVVLLHRLARRAFAEPVSLLAAFLMATYWGFIFFEAELNSPALIVGAVLGILNLALDWAEAPRRKTLAWLGLLFGLLVLDRPETILFLPVLFGWLLAAGGRALPLPRRAMEAAIVPLVVVLCILPVTLRNYLRSGEFVPICTIGGLNLYAGNNPDATGYFPNLDYRAMFGIAQELRHENFPQLVEGLERKTGQQGLQQSDLESYFVSEALRFMRENPGRTFVLWLKKAAFFWGPHEISSDKVFELEKRENPVIRFFPPFAVFMSLAVTGLVLLLIRRRVPDFGITLRPQAWRVLSLVGLFVLVSFGTHLLFFVVARFRIPVVPFVLLFAALALFHGLRVLLRRDSTLTGLWVGVLAIAALIFGIAWVPYQPDAVLHHFYRGVTYAHLGNVPDAIREFKLAIAEGGDKSPAVCSELGFGLSVQGELDNALFWYDKALALDPNHVPSLLRKGEILLARSENAEAAEALRRAVQEDFTDVPSRLGLVRALVRLDQVPEAEAIARETVERGFNPFAGELMLGEIASHVGRFEEALQHYQRAAELQPGDADVYNLMGMQLAALQRYDEAIAQYEKALELRPKFAIAFTNLGNLYAHRGDYDKAIVEYMDALNADLFEPGAEYGWGFVNAQRGEIDKAIQRFQNAVEKRPAYVEAHNYLGFLLMQQGRLDEARFHLERAVRLNPHMLPALNNLGDLYQKLGLRAEAQKQYQAVLALAPGEPYATQQLRALGAAPAPSAAPAPAPVIEEKNGQKVLRFPGS